MQHTTGVAVVATQLAQTDRRALSQAWYSALHLAGPPQGRHVQSAPAPNGASTGSRGATAANRAPDRRAADCAVRTRRDAGNTGSRCDGGTAERRVPKTELARQIERGLAQRAPRRAATSFAVRGTDGRVQLIVRSDGARTRVVAVCAPSLRERVERALAQARFALAGCGVRAEVA